MDRKWCQIGWLCQSCQTQPTILCSLPAARSWASFVDEMFQLTLKELRLPMVLPQDFQEAGNCHVALRHNMCGCAIFICQVLSQPRTRPPRLSLPAAEWAKIMRQSLLPARFHSLSDSSIACTLQFSILPWKEEDGLSLQACMDQVAIFWQSCAHRQPFTSWSKLCRCECLESSLSLWLERVESGTILQEACVHLLAMLVKKILQSLCWGFLAQVPLLLDSFGVIHRSSPLSEECFSSLNSAIL